MGFTRSLNEPTVYSKKQDDNCILLLCLYVDDILYTGSSEKYLKEFRDSMMNTFEMSDLGPMSYFLGLEIVQRRGLIFVSQHKNAVDLLHKTGMMNCKAIDTPMNSNEKLHLYDNSGETDPLRYWRINGGFLYLTHTHTQI